MAKVFYSSHNEYIRVFEDSSGQMYLSIKPLPIVVFVVIFLVLLVAARIVSLGAIKRKASPKAKPPEPASVPTAPSFVRPQIRRLTL